MCMKKLLLLLAFPLFALSVSAQNDDGIESLRVNFKGSAPTICDFVDAILGGEELGEALGLLDSYWNLYKKASEMPPAVTLRVDKPNGYVFFNHYYAEDQSNLSIETCYWNCKDGRHKIVAQSIASSRNGVPMVGQYDGIMFYTYDSKTRLMKWTPTVEVCGEEFNDRGFTDGTVIKLPHKGKDISVSFPEDGVTKHYLLKWTGNGFTFVKK